MITENNYLKYSIIANILWSFVIIFTIELKRRFNIDHNQMLFFMMSFTAIFYGGYTILFKLKKIQKEFKREQIKTFVYLIIIGAVSFLGYRYSLYYGLQNENAFAINSLNYTWVIFMVIIAVMMGNTKAEQIDLYSKYMFIFGLIGVFFIFGVFNQDLNISWVYILMVFASLLTAIENNIIVKIKNMIIDDFVFIYTIYATIIILIMIMISYVADVTILPKSLEQTMYLTGISAFFLLTMYLWLNSYHKGDKVIVSYLGYIIPILSNGLLLLLYDYEVTTSMMIGFFIILLSGVLLNPNIKNRIITRIKYREYF